MSAAVASPASTTPAAPAELTDVDLASLEAELSSATTSVVDNGPKLNLYGFADFTFQAELGKRSGVDPVRPTFAVGNLNLYLSSELSQSWRSLIEVRFLYIPHGTIPSADRYKPTATRTDTSAPDPADLGRPVRWGGVEIERAQLEYTYGGQLSVQVGQWLTPYGIWNVDHGSPTFIPTTRPYIIGEGLIPERQTGIHAFGSVFIDATQLGYHLTLSNGRGPIDAFQDLDNNKGVGGRLWIRNDSLLGTLSLGVSGYRGTYTDRPTPYAAFNAQGTLVPNEVVSARYEELALAADLKWEWQNFLLQGEVVMNDVAYDDRTRPIDYGVGGGPPGFAADGRRIGVYYLAGYRTPWWNTMPYLMYSDYKDGFLSTAHGVLGGFNLQPVPQVVLKFEFLTAWFTKHEIPQFEEFTSQVAWSF